MNNLSIAQAQKGLEDLINQEVSDRIAADNTLDAEIKKRTVEELNGANGLARIWNESDGGGVQFQNKDGTYSFVGVNDGGKNGVTGQIYSVDKNDSNKGTRINMTNAGFFYTNGKTSPAYTEEDEIATKGVVKNAVDTLDENLEEIAHTGNVNDLNQDDGDYLILDCNI